MDIEKFWSMIEEARQGSKQFELDLDQKIQKATFLTDSLTRMSLQDIQEFDRIFYTLMLQAFRADLWDMANLVKCGCSDDGFEYFLGWLIGEGQSNYEKVLANPESLGDMVDKRQRFYISNDMMLGVASSAYEQLTGEWMKESGYPERPVLVGGPLKSVEEMQVQYPEIVAKLGDCDDDEIYP